MKSLKAKLVIQIITFILIFGDAYADCSISLYDAGYFSNDGVKNVVNLFTNYLYQNSLTIHNIEELLSEIFEIDFSSINFTDHYYTIYLILKIKQTKIQNADDWCLYNAVKIFKRKEDKKPTKTTDNPEAVKIELPDETIINIEDTEHETPTKSIDNPEIVLTVVDELPDETIINMCVVELKKRGYIYNKGLFNYAFSKKEPSLLKPYTDYLRKESKNELEADNTDDKHNILTDEKQSISTDKQQKTSIDKDTSKNHEYLKIVEKLYLNSWCIKYASSYSMIGYSDERKKRFERIFKGRDTVLFTTLHLSCVGSLMADGFIQENAKESYAFIETETHFLTPYNEYLDEEAEKLTKDFDGLTKWCENNNRILELETWLKNEKSNTENPDS